MTTFDTSLLSPEDDELELPLVKPVWRPLFNMLAILVVLTLFVYFVGGNLQLETSQRPVAAALFALVPLGLWWLLMWRGESRVQHPRLELPRVLLMSCLVTGAVTTLIIEQFIVPDAWLNTVGGGQRIVGYTITVGVVTELSKYLILRYMIWPQAFRWRVDGVAYSVIISIGVATVFNLRFALLEGGAQPGSAAIQITSMVMMQVAAGLPTVYGLIRLKFNRVGLFELAFYLLLGALLQGFFIVVRVSMLVRGFGIGSTANTPFLSLIFAALFAFIVSFVFAFLINADDQRDIRTAQLRPLDV